MQMVQLPTSPRRSSSKQQVAGSDSTISPAWSIVSNMDSEGSLACMQSATQTLKYASGLHQRRTDSSGSAGSDDDLYRAAQLDQQSGL
jgi:hypothetical protein